MAKTKNPLIKFITGILQDAVSLSLSNFIAARLEEQYNKLFGIETDEEKEESKDG